MKKILNQPANFVSEMLDGLIKAHPAQLAFAAGEPNCIVRADAVGRGAALGAAAQACLAAARTGRDVVIPLRSKIRRAGWVGERTENQPDAGTVLFVNVVEAALNTPHSQPGSTNLPVYGATRRAAFAPSMSV